MKFLVDRMLGKLAKGLRMLGYDTVYYRGQETYPMFRQAREEDRVILSRSAKLQPKRTEDRVVRLAEDNPSLQLKELVRKGIVTLEQENLLTRCLLCNTLLAEIPRERAEGKVPEFIFYKEEAFFQCSECQRIYWQGSHQEHMKEWVDRLFGANDKSQALDNK